MKTILIFLMLFILAPYQALAQEKPVEVVATFSLLGDLVKQVGGDLVHVKTLVGPDSDLHTYNPTPAHSKALSEADIFVENGLGLEGWADRLVSASGFKGRVAIASEGITPRQMDGDADHAHQQIADPHAWQNVAYTRIYIKNIADVLADTRPSHAADFQARAKAYDAELQKLDAWVKAQISSVPVEKRKIITSHDAFGYFGAAYGVTFIASQGLSTEAAPTATQVAKLIEQMKALRIKRVFFESLASPKLITQLAKDAKVSVGKPVYSDALSSANGPAATYIDMVRYNVTQFIGAMVLTGDT